MCQTSSMETGLLAFPHTGRKNSWLHTAKPWEKQLTRLVGFVPLMFHWWHRVCPLVSTYLVLWLRKWLIPAEVYVSAASTSIQVSFQPVWASFRVCSREAEPLLQNDLPSTKWPSPRVGRTGHWSGLHSSDIYSSLNAEPQTRFQPQSSDETDFELCFYSDSLTSRLILVPTANSESCFKPFISWQSQFVWAGAGNL